MKKVNSFSLIINISYLCLLTPWPFEAIKISQKLHSLHFSISRNWIARVCFLSKSIWLKKDLWHRWLRYNWTEDAVHKFCQVRCHLLWDATLEITLNDILCLAKKTYHRLRRGKRDLKPVIVNNLWKMAKA